LEPTQAHIRARPKVISGRILQRSIPSGETKLNDDILSETATLQLTPRVLEPYILDIYNGQFCLLFSPVADEVCLKNTLYCYENYNNCKERLYVLSSLT
jgi:hypothetical protein